MSVFLCLCYVRVQRPRVCYRRSRVCVCFLRLKCYAFPLKYTHMRVALVCVLSVFVHSTAQLSLCVVCCSHILVLASSRKSPLHVVSVYTCVCICVCMLACPVRPHTKTRTLLVLSPLVRCGPLSPLSHLAAWPNEARAQPDRSGQRATDVGRRARAALVHDRPSAHAAVLHNIPIDS